MEQSASATRIVVTETDPIITPRDPNAPHNFGPISYRENTLYTAERPGHYHKDYSIKVVDEWIQFMKEKGITNVLIVMDDNEFEVYEMDLMEYYKTSGLNVDHIPLAVDSYKKTMALIQDLETKGKKVVTHCTGGKGRSGRVACAWLCQRYNLSPLDASQEFIDQAVEYGLYRLADVQKLNKWIGYETS